MKSLAFYIWKPQVWYGSAPAYRLMGPYGHMLVPEMGGANRIPCSILFSVAEPVFHSSVEKHVCYSPPGSAASSPSSPWQWLWQHPWMVVAAGTAECTGLTTADFLTPFKARGIGQNVQWASLVWAEFNWTKSRNLGCISSSMVSWRYYLTFRYYLLCPVT